MKRKKKNNSKRKTSSYSKLNLFQKSGIKFFRPCPLSGKFAQKCASRNSATSGTLAQNLTAFRFD